MKRFWALTLAALMLLGLSACGGQKEETALPPADTAGVSDTDAPDSAAPEEEKEEPAEEEEPEEEPEEAEAKGDLPADGTYTLGSAYPFSGGMACITFQDKDYAWYTGVIDTSGKLLHYAADEFNLNGLWYENGFVRGRSVTNRTYYVIAPDGKAVGYEFEEGVGVTPAATGDGYVVIKEDKSGFEAVEYLYHVYDETGKELTTYFTTDSSVTIRYVGEGTFFFRTKGDTNSAREAYGSAEFYDIYFAKSNSWLNGQVISTNFSPFDFHFVDDVFMFRQAASRNCEHPREVAYTDSKGTIQTFTLPEVEGQDYSYIGCSNGLLFFRSSTRQIICYDTKSKTTSTYQGKFAESDKMTWDFVIGDGYMAIGLRGADNNTYTMLLNSKLEDVLSEPLLGIPAAIQDGVLYTMASWTLHAHDLKGTELGEIPNGTVKNLGDGIILADSNKYVKPDGTPAFEEIDYSNAKRVTLPA